MKGIIAFFKQKWLIELVGIVALCVLIWFLGPKFAYDKKAPLELEINRVWGILSVIAAWFVYNMALKIRANKKDQQLMADLVAPKVDSTRAAMGETEKEEAVIVEQKLEKGLKFLKKTLSKNRFDRKYIYELPWYVIIGSPGCGKTTLLYNSGLHFSVSQHLGEDEISGVGGTRNCTWMFSDSAIFLDTAGRWTTQDSHRSVDEAGWKAFLKKIKQFRPRRPVNGVLVTMSMDDLLKLSEEDRYHHAKAIRKRIAELYKELGVQFPIYILFTKCDLVAGFTEFFAKLKQEERSQVWGETFQDADLKNTNQNIIRFESNFEKLLHRLDRLTFRRIQEERDIQRRSLVLDFPQQMKLLKPAIRGFLRDAFRTDKFEEFSPLIRGVYFTSATQEGAPIDRVMSFLAATYGIDRQKPSVFKGRGKSFFITRLLKEVVLKEADLVGTDPKFERRRGNLQWATMGFFIILFCVLTFLWQRSYSNNKIALKNVEQQIKKYEDLENLRKVPLKTTAGNVMDRYLFKRLDIMQKIDYDQNKGLMGLGLYQGNKMRAGVEWVYRDLLEKRLLPDVKECLQDSLENRIEDQLWGSKGKHVDVLPDLLKIYMLLGQPGQRDLKQKTLQSHSDWIKCFDNEPQIENQLKMHLNNLLDEPLIEPDDTLIAKVKRELKRQPLDDQIYQSLRSEAKNYVDDIRLINVLRPYGNQVFSNLNDLSIPGFYTYKGYNEFFKIYGLKSVQKKLEENRKLGMYSQGHIPDPSQLWKDLQKKYFDNYEKIWLSMLSSLKIKVATGDNDLIRLMGSLSDEKDTPLRPLLELVKENTTLNRGQTLKNSLASEGARALEKRFKDLNDLVTKVDSSPPPLDSIIKSLSKVQDILKQMRSDSESFKNIRDGESDPFKAAGLDVESQPEPFNGWMSSLISSSVNIANANTKSELNERWRTEVYEPYKEGIQGCYPISKKSSCNVELLDFINFFKPNGRMDQFFKTQIKPLLNNQTLKFSKNILKQFQLADIIRKTFFASGGSNPQIQFELTPIDLDKRVRNFKMNLEGQEIEYHFNRPKISIFEWPGPKPNVGVRIIFQFNNRKDVIQTKEGPWAWFKILDEATIQSRKSNEYTVTFNVGGYYMTYKLQPRSAYHLFKFKEYQQFSLPKSL